MPSEERESLQLLQGTLDLIVLRTLSALGAQHAYQIATRLQQVSQNHLSLNQGTLYRPRPPRTVWMDQRRVGPNGMQQGSKILFDH